MTPSLPTLLVIVATIVAGEVGSTVPAARLPVACTVVEDHHRGHHLSARWYGRAAPAPADLEAARLALAGSCTHLPYFRFLGSARDLETWIRLGYVDPTTDEIWTWTRGRWTAVGVVDRTPYPQSPPSPSLATATIPLPCSVQPCSRDEPSQPSNVPTFQPVPRARVGAQRSTFNFQPLTFNLPYRSIPR